MNKKPLKEISPKRKQREQVRDIFQRLLKNNLPSPYEYFKKVSEYTIAKTIFSEIHWPYSYETMHKLNIPNKHLQKEANKPWENFEIFQGIDEYLSNKLEQKALEKEINLLVLYNIITKRGPREGSRLGLKFASKFNLDLNIPVQYSVDTSDPFLYEFLSSALNNKKINPLAICPVNYHDPRYTKDGLVKVAPLSEVVKDLERLLF